MCGLGGEEDVQQVVEELAVVHGADSLLFQVVEQEEVRELSSMINSGVRGHSGRGGQLLLTHQDPEEIILELRIGFPTDYGEKAL